MTLRDISKRNHSNDPLRTYSALGTILGSLLCLSKFLDESNRECGLLLFAKAKTKTTIKKEGQFLLAQLLR